MALFREFLVSTCRARLLVHRLVLSAALSACQAVSSAWCALLSDCPAALSVCRAVPSAPLLVWQAVSSGWRNVLVDSPATLSACRAVPSAPLLVCQALSSGWRNVSSDCPATLSACRGVPLAPLSACQAVSSAWRAVLSACQAAPWLSHFSPVPRLENWSVLPGKPMRVRPLASVISISSNSSGMVICSTSARRLGGQDRQQGQHGGNDNYHIFA